MTKLVSKNRSLHTAEENATMLLLGNEAIVRGALEAGVVFVCGYPGTPASEINDAFASIGPKRGVAFEYSVNEKISLEMAFAASLAGARSLAAMKHLGLTYAGDPLTTMPYVGTVGGMVIVSAADPSCRTSPNEQDQRYLASMLHIPTLDPSTPQEALEMTRFAFELSERSQLPVLLRPTTRLCHTRAAVRLGRLRDPKVTGFKRNPGRFVPIPKNARKLRLEIPGRLEKADLLMRETGFFGARQAGKKKAILASGVPSAIVADLLASDDAREEVTLLHLGVVHPLPEQWLARQLEGVETLVVVEELAPYLEDAARAVCSLHRLPTQVLGKRTGHFPTEFEYEPDIVRAGVMKALGWSADASADLPEQAQPLEPSVPPRPPVLCASCGHRGAFFAARSVFGSDALFFNDIGCYTLGGSEPLNSADALLCMGAGFTLAAGVSRVTGERTIGFLGDSTFFHSGMPALLDAVKEDANIVAVILDNQVTAMTGFQESPFVEVGKTGVNRTVDIEAIVRAMGAPQVETVDPNDLPAITAAFERARDATGPSVVIARRPCAVFEARVNPPAPGTSLTYVIDQDRCRHCGREDSGHRCNVKTTVEYERAMTRARSRSLPVVSNAKTETEVAPCASACPLFLCVQGYAASIAAGDYADALEQIMSRLPLPDSICRVCERPCEDKCVLADAKSPVAINELKRFVVGWANSQPEFPYQPSVEEAHGKNVAVVGAGPSGLAAAHDLRLRGYDVTLYDANDEPGGLLLTGIPRYRLPLEALRRDVARVLELGVRFEGNRRLGRDVHLHELLQGFDAVYLAVGAQRTHKLDLPGAPLIDALSYLRSARSSDFETGRRVLIIGGGNSAVDAARTAVRTGAQKVVIACLESREEMPAIEEEIESAEHEGVEILTRVKAIEWTDQGMKIVCVAPRQSNNFHPDNFSSVPGTETIIEADRVIAAIGQTLDPEIVGKGDPDLGWTEGRRLEIDTETCRTAHPQVFAGGDSGNGQRTVTTAIAEGLRAAWGIDRFLRGAEIADKRLPPPRPAPMRPTNGEQSPTMMPSKLLQLHHQPRRSPPELDRATRTSTFEEVHGVLSEVDAREEARRCMICGQCGNCRSCLDLFGCPAFRTSNGQIVIDSELCTGCGVCAQFCPNGAIVPRKSVSA